MEWLLNILKTLQGKGIIGSSGAAGAMSVRDKVPAYEPSSANLPESMYNRQLSSLAPSDMWQYFYGRMFSGKLGGSKLLDALPGVRMGVEGAQSGSSMWDDFTKMNPALQTITSLFGGGK